METRLRPSSLQRAQTDIDEDTRQPADHHDAAHAAFTTLEESVPPLETTIANPEGQGQDDTCMERIPPCPLQTPGFDPDMEAPDAGQPLARSPIGLLSFETFMFGNDVQLDACEGGELVNVGLHVLAAPETFPNELRALLVDHFFRVIYPIFPIIREKDFRGQFNGRFSCHNDNHELSFVLYALLAVAASGLKSGHSISEDPRLRAYDSVDLGDLFYSYAATKFPLPLSSTKLGINSVIGHGLLSLCLAESGKGYEAWITMGHAIRLYQSLDLRDGVHATTSQYPDAMPSTHDNLWWSLYVLDRSLSTVLRMPLAIDDAECDLEHERKPSTPKTHRGMEFWFSVIVDFHRIIGRIYRSVRSIRKSARSSSPILDDKLRAYVRQHDGELEGYHTEQVLPRIEEPPPTPEAAALQTIAVSSYYAGLILLHRPFLETYAVMEPDMFLRCAEAASSCIKLTPRLAATVPASHFLIQQSRALFASIKVLLHGMRLACNSNFTARALSDIEAGVGMLRDLEIQWPETKKYQVLIQEEMQSTRAELERRQKISEAFDRFGLELPNEQRHVLDRLSDLNAIRNRGLRHSAAEEQPVSRQHANVHVHVSSGAVDSTHAVQSTPVPCSAGTQHCGPPEPATYTKRRKTGHGGSHFTRTGAMEPSTIQSNTDTAVDQSNHSPSAICAFQPSDLSRRSISTASTAGDFIISSLNHSFLQDNE